jgi:hypothetical protein
MLQTVPDPSALLGYQVWENQYTGTFASNSLAVAARARLFDQRESSQKAFTWFIAWAGDKTGCVLKVALQQRRRRHDELTL